MGLVKKVALALFIGGASCGYFLGYYINTDRQYKIKREYSVAYLIDKKHNSQVEIDSFLFLNSEPSSGNELGDKLFRRGLNKIKHEVGDSIDSLLKFEE
ncbi:hypothetical protein HN587_04775 [Candidatus Woesearchaeota archaeon]|jgi:hypothetical protein|nr:hypothetical protein [Candidatus Woesearchaeota archaeon]